MESGSSLILNCAFFFLLPGKFYFHAACSGIRQVKEADDNKDSKKSSAATVKVVQTVAETKPVIEEWKHIPDIVIHVKSMGDS